MRIRSARASALLAVIAAGSVAAQTFENLGSNYERLRGVNYVPNYPSLNSYVGNTSAPFPYYGVASPTAMWKFYDPSGPTSAAVAQQLDWIKQTGFNAVRVFLSYPAWLHYRSNPPAGTTGNAFINRFKHFVGLCHARAIRVMPVVWDGVAVHSSENSVATACTVHPDYADPIGDVPAASSPGGVSNISYWHRNPGEPVMTTILSEDQPFENSLAGLYLQDCISVFHDPAQDYSAALLMWDVMNEARCGDVVAWISKSLDAMELFAPNDPKTWGWAVTDRYPQSITLATHPHCDVINLHCYEHRAGAVRSALYDASFITGHSTYPTPYGRPVIFTEIGYPGKGYCYEDAISYCANAPRHGTIGATGVGFMPWAFMIGYRDNQAVGGPVQDNMPFSEGTGLFYFDGQIRDLSAVTAFVNHAALNHGITSGLWGQGSLGWPQPKPSTDRYYVNPGAIATFDDETTQDYWMTNSWMYSVTGVWTVQGYLDVSHWLRLLVDTGVWPAMLASTNNGNPYTWPGSTLPGYANYLPPSQLMTYRNESLPDFTPGSAWLSMIRRLELQFAPSLPAGWLRPWEGLPSNPDQQLHVDLLVYGFLGPFALEAGQFLAPR